jgi:dTDP-4-dehydrorhamnose 3,5-epimerase/reductase
MASLAGRGVSPEVVNAQFGQLTFTTEITSAIVHLLRAKRAMGTYNLSNNGEP